VSEVNTAILHAANAEMLPYGIHIADLRAVYHGAPPRRADGGSQHIGLEAVAHLIAARAAQRSWWRRLRDRRYP
jgi:hypothetical protein